MKLRSILSFLLLASMLSACSMLNTSGGQQAQPSDTPAVPPTDTPAVPTGTPVPPGATLPSVPSDTPSVPPPDTPAVPTVPMLSAGTASVNCRFGPGTGYVSEGAFNPGLSVPILGRNASGGWWQIQNPGNSGQQCWVSNSVTTVTGDTANVPIVAAPQPFVIGISVDQPPVDKVPGCIGPIPPIKLTGTIVVNGPVKVGFHFVSQQDEDLTSQSATFTTSGAHTVSEISYYAPLVAGTYWFKLVVTSPNSMVAESTYTITCP